MSFFNVRHNTNRFTTSNSFLRSTKDWSANWKRAPSRADLPPPSLFVLSLLSFPLFLLVSYLFPSLSTFFSLLLSPLSLLLSSLLISSPLPSPPPFFPPSLSSSPLLPLTCVRTLYEFSLDENQTCFFSSSGLSCAPKEKEEVTTNLAGSCKGDRGRRDDTFVSC